MLIHYRNSFPNAFLGIVDKKKMKGRRQLDRISSIFVHVYQFMYGDISVSVTTCIFLKNILFVWVFMFHLGIVHSYGDVYAFMMMT